MLIQSTLSNIKSLALLFILFKQGTQKMESSTARASVGGHIKTYSVRWLSRNSITAMVQTSAGNFSLVRAKAICKAIIWSSSLHFPSEKVTKKCWRKSLSFENQEKNDAGVEDV